MSREQLVDEYLRGHISRRTFVRRLVGLGVSLSAAVTYAEVMPARAHAAPYYPLTDHPESPPTASPSPPAPPDQDLTAPKVGLSAGKATDTGISFTVTLSKPGTATVSASAHGKSLGTASVNLPRGGAVRGSVSFTKAGRKQAKKAKSATLRVSALDLAGNPAGKSITVAI